MNQLEITLTVSEQIDRAKKGRSQISIITEMREDYGIEITDVQFSRKKKGLVDAFTHLEIRALNKILKPRPRISLP